MKICLTKFLLDQVTLIFALACFALVPHARAVCQEGCFTNENTALGEDALSSVTSGFGDAASGYEALFSTTTGNLNTATGFAALLLNTSGSNNTANGAFALLSTGIGSNNTANGYAALNTNSTGSENTAIGYEALYSKTAGTGSTAVGAYALFSDVSNFSFGGSNTAVGYAALFSTTTAAWNTAVGESALAQNTNGSDNVAVGSNSLVSNVSGTDNTALGSFAGAGIVGSRNTMIGQGTYAITEPPTQGDDNTGVGSDVFRFSGGFFSTGPINNNTGIGSAALSNCQGNNNTATGVGALRGSFNDNIFSNNTAMGYEALLNLDNGNNNTAIGSQALFSTTTGNNNTAAGINSLFSNTTGTRNTAQGASALLNNTTGRFNTAIGNQALQANTTGIGNIALGDSAGINLTTGSNNIDIGNGGNAGEAATIRIGKNTVQSATFIAGIRGATVAGGITVLIDGNGRLGTSTSSARFKERIQPMDKASEAILGLEPVTFRYKRELDPHGIPQFGLVAEEVEKVNPDLVALDEQGKPYAVRYEAVNAMLLNEFLKEHKKVEQLKRNFESKIADQQKQIEALTAGLQKVSTQLEVSTSAPQTVLSRH